MGELGMGKAAEVCRLYPLTSYFEMWSLIMIVAEREPSGIALIG
jgi:hypothetical protein